MGLQFAHDENGSKLFCHSDLSDAEGVLFNMPASISLNTCHKGSVRL